MDLIVPDASVILKWYFPREDWVKQAFWLKENYLLGNVDLIIPAFAIYEVSNVLSLPKNGFSIETTQNAIKDILVLGIRTIPFRKWLIKMAVEMTYTHGVVLYDAIYLAVAKKYNGVWLTADRKAYYKIKDLPYVSWIGDYRSKSS